MGQVLFPEDALQVEPVSILQFWMDTYFGDLNEGTHVIADDVKIHGENETTHDQNLIQVLNQCRKVGLKLNAEKCVFKARSIPFFRHVISDQGVKPDPTKMDVIKNMPTPTSKHELLSFLGLCNYLSTYVPDLNPILQPLCELTKKNAIFNWNHQYDSLYQWAKNHILQNAHTLCYYDPALPVSLETDAESIWSWCCIIATWMTNFIHVKGIELKHNPGTAILSMKS